ncbi:glycosyltransferase family 2 protein [Flavobacterium glaciei]|uniref:Glycosyltransferase involved in cell wall biosynthesis n=1 Tax=Flavobacterium glaciei TaxID=386300 RepID=A0A562Q602_9FLAO|nr:glycosyltransferase family 2 protein [Flavobacterium glaciei]RDI58374.1 glycosyltransferase involved in cell wall biosynthesis [Flavobacterium glaciei]TWI52159.1 glycosyltransferase involved in cell wall biosynthesis [Flavobacterium glaciei]
MKEVLLTVTIATYNVDKFISESIESILNQSFQDFEIICIDDGSHDNTVSILQEFANKDRRVKVIAKKVNQGLAVARNESLALATGTYVMFLDGDDIYDITLFEKAIAVAEKDSSDMVLWDYVSFYENHQIQKLKEQPSDLIGFNVKDKIALLKRPSFTWVKLLRTQKIKEMGIHFPVGLTRQDIPVHWHLVTKLDQISILPERLAYYRQQPDATTAKKDKKLFHLAFVMDIVQKYLKDNQLYDLYRSTFLDQQINFLAGMYDNIKKEYKAEALVLIKDRMKPEHFLYLNEKNGLRQQTKYFFAAMNGSLKAKLQMQMWYISRAIFRKIKS